MKRNAHSLALNQSLPQKSRYIDLVLILGSLGVIGPLSIDMYLPAFPAIAENFSTQPALVQLTLTLFIIGMATGQLLAGPLSDRFGRRIPLLIGTSAYATFSLLCALSPSIWAFVVLRFAQGFTGAAGIVISRAIVRDRFSGTKMTKMFTLLMVVHGAGPIFAPIIGGQLLHFTTWRGVFVVLFVFGLLLLSAVFFRLPESLAVENRSQGGLKDTFATFWRLIRDRNFMGYVLTQGFISAALFSYIISSSFVLQNIYGVSPQMFSIIFAANGVGFLIASQITGALVGRISEKRLLLIGILTAMTGGIWLFISTLSGAMLIIVLPAFFLVVSSLGIVGPTSTSLAMQTQKKTAGSAAAMLGVLNLLIGGLVSPLIGLFGTESPVPMGTIIFLTTLISLLCYLLMNTSVQTKRVRSYDK